MSVARTPVKNVIKVINSSNLPTTSYKNLKDFQGDLKIVTDESLNKMKQSIIINGIFVPKFVWFNENKDMMIMDGHTTTKALGELERDGWVIPEIPYCMIAAKNRTDASKKLLILNSQYGTINPETSFLVDYNLDLKSVMGEIDIPELEIFQIDDSLPTVEELTKAGTADKTKLESITEKGVQENARFSAVFWFDDEETFASIVERYGTTSKHSFNSEQLLNDVRLLNEV
uniref:ParB/Sulfiredoxin domain-containing protein n=1 Tax=viral metagenome TaxID=1070528 RepID=A0A6M3IMQ3_9ZZZZ